MYDVVIRHSRPWPRRRRFLLVASAAALLWIVPTPAPATLQMTHWTTATSDTWIAPPRWDNGVPNNGINTYDAFITAAGPAYTVTLDTSVVVDLLVINNASAKVSIVNGGVLSATQSINLQAGSLALAGGKIASTIVNATVPLTATNSGGELSGVAVNGDLNINTINASLTVSNSTTFGTAHLSANNAAINLADGYTLSSHVAFEGSDSDTPRVVNGVVDGGYTIGATGVIDTQPGLGQDGLLANGDVTNHGLISSQVAGLGITINTHSFTNHGTVQATDGSLVNFGAATLTNAADGVIKVSGGSTVTLAGDWTNSGAVQIGETDFLYLGGSVTTAGLGLAGWSNAGGIVNLTGQLDNTAAALTLNNTTGSWNLAGGKITGGSLAFADGKSLGITGGGGELSGVTVNGDLSIADAGGFFFLSNGTTFSTAHLSGDGAGIIVDTGQSISGTVQFEAGGSALGRSLVGTVDGLWAIGPTGVVRTQPDLNADASLFNGTLTNNGTILSQVDGRTISIFPDTFINHGSVQAANGGRVLLGAPTTTNDGTLVANGGVSGVDSFTNNGGTATLGGFQSWNVGSTLRVNAGAVTLSGNPAGPDFGYNTAAIITPAAGNATLTISGGTANQFQLRTITLNAPGAGGNGLLVLGAAADNGDVNPQNHFGSPGGSVAVYLGTTTDVSPDPMSPMFVLTRAPRATIEALWRSAVLEGYWALQNHLVTSVTRGVTIAPGVVTNTSKFGLVIVPSIDALGRAITYLGEDITGDTNGDGKVDINDLGNVLQHLNTTPGSQAGESGFTIYTPGEGDVNGDLVVNISDLGAVLGNLNQTYAPASALGGAGSTAPVPEPASGAVLATVAAALLPARRRRGGASSRER